MDFLDVIDESSLETLEAAISGNGASPSTASVAPSTDTNTKPEPPAVTEPAVTTPAVTEPTADATSSPVTEPTTDPLADVAGRYRVDRMSELNQLTVHIMSKNPDMTPSQAEELARKDLNLPATVPSPDQTNTTVPSVGVTPPEPVVSPVEELRNKLGEMENKLTEAGAAEGLFTAEIAQMQSEHAKLAAKLALAEQTEANALADDEAQFMQARNESLKTAKTLHPDMLDPTSALYQKTSEIIAALTKSGDALLESVEAPEIITLKALRALGMTAQPQAKAAVQPTPDATVPTQTTPAVQPPVLPGGGRNGGGAQPTPADLAGTIQSAFEGDDDSLLTGALFGNGTNGFKAPLIR